MQVFDQVEYRGNIYYTTTLGGVYIATGELVGVHKKGVIYLFNDVHIQIDNFDIKTAHLL